MPELSVAVFQAEWPIQKQTTNLIRLLASAGYDVDVFLYCVSERLETLSAIEQQIGVRVFRFDRDSFAPIGAPLGEARRGEHRKAPGWLSQRASAISAKGRSKAIALSRIIGDWAGFALHVGDTERVLPGHLLVATTTRMDGRKYACMFGVEKMGLVWAGMMAERCGTRCVYFSLELYTKGFPGLNDVRYRRLKRLECRFHNQSAATIIQDEPRADVLFSDTGAERKTVFYVPVSILGPPIQEKPRVMRDLLNIPDGMTIILMFGNLFGVRFVRELVAAAQTFPPEWIVVMHGPWPGTSMQKELQALDRKNKVVLSTELLPAAQIDEFVASADIGLALYPDRTMNEYLTGKSSEKVALYAKAGVPVIAFDYPSFTSVFDACHSGVGISSIEHMLAGIRSILEDYQTYRQGAFRAYREIYEFSQHFGQIERWLHNSAHS